MIIKDECQANFFGFLLILLFCLFDIEKINFKFHIFMCLGEIWATKATDASPVRPKHT